MTIISHSIHKLLSENIAFGYLSYSDYPSAMSGFSLALTMPLVLLSLGSYVILHYDFFDLSEQPFIMHLKTNV